MRLRATYGGCEAQRFPRKPVPYGAGWAEVADIAHAILVYQSEPNDPGEHSCLLLAHDGEGNEVRRKKIHAWGW